MRFRHSLFVLCAGFLVGLVAPKHGCAQNEFLHPIGDLNNFTNEHWDDFDHGQISDVVIPPATAGLDPESVTLIRDERTIKQGYRFHVPTDANKTNFQVHMAYRNPTQEQIVLKFSLMTDRVPNSTTEYSIRLNPNQSTHWNCSEDSVDSPVDPNATEMWLVFNSFSGLPQGSTISIHALVLSATVSSVGSNCPPSPPPIHIMGIGSGYVDRESSGSVYVNWPGECDPACSGYKVYYLVGANWVLGFSTTNPNVTEGKVLLPSPYSNYHFLVRKILYGQEMDICTGITGKTSQVLRPNGWYTTDGDDFSDYTYVDDNIEQFGSGTADSKDFSVSENGKFGFYRLSSPSPSPGSTYSKARVHLLWERSGTSDGDKRINIQLAVGATLSAVKEFKHYTPNSAHWAHRDGGDTELAYLEFVRTSNTDFPNGAVPMNDNTEVRIESDFPQENDSILLHAIYVEVFP